MDIQEYPNESFVYFSSKEILKGLGWTLVAGEPAGGSDNLPRIEIRDPKMSHKGSKGAYKIDVISIKNHTLLLTEVKVGFDVSDVDKLNEICSERREHLKNALLERLGLNIDNYKIVKSLALKNVRADQIPLDFVCFVVGDPSITIHPELLLEN